MNFQLTAPQKALKKDLVKAGFMGLTIPKEYGGAGARSSTSSSSSRKSRAPAA